MALTPEQLAELEKEKQVIVEEQQKEETENVQQQNAVVNVEQSSQGLQAKMNDTMAGFLDKVVDNHQDDMLSLTDTAFKSELEIRETQVRGRKEKEKAKVEKEIAEEKTKEDEAKHERSKTILKAQGLTSQLPKLFRITALITGYPFFIIYLLTVGWVVEFLTFTIKGFLTMIADCIERFTDVNKRIIDNSKDENFKLGRAIINILKWVLIIGAIVAVIVLLIVRK